MAIANRRKNSIPFMESQRRYRVQKTKTMVPVTRWVVYSIFSSLKSILLITAHLRPDFPVIYSSRHVYVRIFSYNSHDIISPTHLTRFALIVLKKPG
jgi:hypothetical protein